MGTESGWKWNRHRNQGEIGMEMESEMESGWNLNGNGNGIGMESESEMESGWNWNPNQTWNRKWDWDENGIGGAKRTYQLSKPACNRTP